MATNELAFASSCSAPKIARNYFLLVFIATKVIAGQNDNLKLKHFHKNLVVPELGNNGTPWLPDDFRLTSPNKESSRRRKRAKWETGEIRDENEPEYIADEKSEWQKQMEKISPRESEKWKKYQTKKSKSLDTGKIHGSLIKNSDSRMRNGVTRKRRRNTRRKKILRPSKAANAHTTSKNLGGYQSKEWKKPLGNQRVENGDISEDFFPKIKIGNERWRMRRNQKPDSRNLLKKSGRLRTWNKPKKVKPKLSYYVINKIENESTNKEKPKLRKKELEKLRTIEPENRLKRMENGRWGMSGRNEPPSEVKNEIFRRKAIRNGGKIDEAEILWKEIDTRVVKSPGQLGEYIQNERLENIQRKDPKEFLSTTESNEGTRTVGKHSSLLKSGKEETEEMRNFGSYSSENEYWENKDTKTSQGTIENTRRTLNLQDLPSSPRNNEKFQGSNTPPGIRDFIQIIIPPSYNDAEIFLNGIELSIDQLFPEKKRSINLAKTQPIVTAGLSTRIRYDDERR